MKTDNYTKVILTIIVIYLAINVVKDFEVFQQLMPMYKKTSDKLDVNLNEICGF